jgi:hypothetical protein
MKVVYCEKQKLAIYRWRANNLQKQREITKKATRKWRSWLKISKEFNSILL